MLNCIPLQNYSAKADDVTQFYYYIIIPSPYALLRAYGHLADQWPVHPDEDLLTCAHAVDQANEAWDPESVDLSYSRYQRLAGRKSAPKLGTRGWKNLFYCLGLLFQAAFIIYTWVTREVLKFRQCVVKFRHIPIDGVNCRLDSSCETTRDIYRPVSKLKHLSKLGHFTCTEKMLHQSLQLTTLYITARCTDNCTVHVLSNDRAFHMLLYCIYWTTRD